MKRMQAINGRPRVLNEFVTHIKWEILFVIGKTDVSIRHRRKWRKTEIHNIKTESKYMYMYIELVS